MREVQIIPGSRPGGSPAPFLFRPYRYNGDQPFDASVVEREYPPCDVQGCQRRVHSRRLCRTHWDRDRAGLPLDDPDKRLRPFDPSFCGTTKGYARHYNHDVPVCKACKDAKNEYDRERYRGRKK